MPITLPVYWTDQRRKYPKTCLLSLNWYRNAHYRDQNNMKKDLAEIVRCEVLKQRIVPVVGAFTLSTKFYYKRASCDAGNVVPVLEKVFLDELQALGTIQQDNVTYHVGTSWIVVGKDSENPRVEIEIVPTT